MSTHRLKFDLDPFFLFSKMENGGEIISFFLCLDNMILWGERLHIVLLHIVLFSIIRCLLHWIYVGLDYEI